MGMLILVIWEISWLCLEIMWIFDLFILGVNYIILFFWWLKIIVIYLYLERDKEIKVYIIELLREDMRLFMLYNNIY